MLQHRRFTYYMIAIIACTLIACKAISNYNAYPITEDIKLGNQVKQQIEADPKAYPILKNSKWTAYIQSMVDEILLSKEIKYKSNFAYKVFILGDDNVINAFCTPGGYIYVYTGLLNFIDNEATLAAVIAHEIAHAELRHSTKRMSQTNILKGIADEYAKKNKNETTKIASNLVQSLTLLNNSRDDEYEADALSFKLLSSSKWYPGGIKYFFEKIIALYNSGGNRFEQLLATHPLPKDRIDKVFAQIKSSNIAPPTEDNLFYRKYSEFKINNITQK